MLKKDLKSVEQVLEKEKTVSVAYLFGSQAKGLEHEKSDVDIGIVLERGKDLSLREQARITLEIEDSLGDEVDLVILNGKHPRFLNQVLKYGKPIYIRSEKARIEFETTAISQYLDMKPHIEEYDQMVRERLTA